MDDKKRISDKQNIFTPEEIASFNDDQKNAQKTKNKQNFAVFANPYSSENYYDIHNGLNLGFNFTAINFFTFPEDDSIEVYLTNPSNYFGIYSFKIKEKSLRNTLIATYRPSQQDPSTDSRAITGLNTSAT